MLEFETRVNLSVDGSKAIVGLRPPFSAHVRRGERVDSLRRSWANWPDGWRLMGKDSPGNANILAVLWLSAAGKNLMLGEVASFWMQSFRKGYTGRSD
jgi:hypothetical protein